MKHFTVTFRPEGRRISIHAGATILEAAGQAGIILNTVCGGVGTCGKCQVALQPGGRKVLACQHRIEGNLTIEVPSESRFFEQQILHHGIDRQIEVAPSIHDQYPDLKTAEHLFGVAVDIGTTTVVAMLIDLADGRCRATAAVENPQIRYGDDVVSRIAHTSVVGGLDELHDTIVSCVNDLIERLCRETAVAASHIYELTVAGNTTMNHIFLKFPVEQLGQAPYKAYSTEAQDRNAGEMQIAINPRGNVHVIESIAGFVGSDITAVAVAVGMDEAEGMTLVVDIGTNGEIVLGTKDRMYAASCAAGPALEGARISQGGRAVEGAIEAVFVSGDDGGDIDVDVIGGPPARTICGSGLIDAVAVLLELGLLDETGRFAEKQSLADKLAAPILDRLIEQDGQPAFVLAHNGDNGNLRVVLTQKDIRETQLAKAAIRAGIQLLQKKAGITDEDIEQVLLAGAFGNYIRRESALAIGLLPNVGVEKVHFVGNAAGSGARMILVSSQCRNIAKAIATGIEYVEIAHEAQFQMVFAEALMFAESARQA